MALYRLLLSNPLLACSVCLCLLAIAAAIRLVRTLSHGSERFIAGFVGLVAIYEGLKILVQAGIWTLPNERAWTDLATLAVTGLFVLALIVVQELGSEGNRTRILLRLMEAVPNASSAGERHLKTEPSEAGTTTKLTAISTNEIVITDAA